MQQKMRVYGLGGGIVKKLATSIPKDFTHILHTDRYFTSVKCAEYLLRNKIYIVGTIMSNRLDNAKNKLKADKEMSREWDEMARNDEMCLIKWKDNKTVTLLSTCIGSEPLSTCKRWSKNEKKKIDVPQPGIVKAYNTSMGGTDLCDRYLAYYRCTVRTKKWPVRVFSHFVDLVISNCWIMHVRYHKQNNLTGAKSLMEYRMLVASALCRYEGNLTTNRGRPRLSSSSDE
ncbi:PiggyBac transposable element-derived protein 3, partial [Stegodyphus mimosarum]